MKMTKWTACLAGVVLAMSSASARAQEDAGPAISDPAVEFSAIRDAVANKFFDAATTVPDPFNPNRLIVGFETGLDFTTLRYRDFRASTAAFNHAIAMDTIRFVVTAPEGYYIATITYSQRGSGSVVRTGRAAGSANWVVGGYASDLGQFLTNPTLSWTMDLTEKEMTQVPVSITNSLFVFSTPALGSANLSLTAADVVVTLKAIPVPEPVVPAEEPAAVAPATETTVAAAEEPAAPVEAPVEVPSLPVVEVSTLAIPVLPWQPWQPVW